MATDQDKYKLIYIKEKPKGKKKVGSYGYIPTKMGKKKWIRMPRSGKIKDLTVKNLRKK